MCVLVASMCVTQVSRGSLRQSRAVKVRTCGRLAREASVCRAPFPELTSEDFRSLGEFVSLAQGK